MKRLKILLLMLLAFCQAEASDFDPIIPRVKECLGVWCYITVDFKNDPVTSDGYFKYTIQTPPNGIQYACMQGPGAPYLFNHLGSTVDLYIRKMRLELDADGYDSVPIELFVDTWIGDSGYYQSMPTDNSNTIKNQCFYQIILNITW